jgi:hypothetical protein
MTIPIDLRSYGRHSFGTARSNAVGSEQAQQTPNTVALEDIANSMRILTSMRIARRGTITSIVSVGTTPTSILKSQKGQGYTIINPTPSVGLTTTQTLLESTAIIVNGNTQLTALGVASYDSIQLFCNVSAVVGAPSLDVYVQAQDPLSLQWVDTQLVFPGLAAASINYANLGNNGIATALALRWVYAGLGVAEPITLSVSAVMKGGLGGSQSGAEQTVYIGADGVSSTSGWPLLEGQSRDIYVEENSELFAVSNTAVNLKIIAW